jgi:hypothetical protein
VKKTDKKIDNKIRSTLSDFCESEKDKEEGFDWVTHFVNYDDFPQSLSIVCIYDKDSNLEKVNRKSILQDLSERLKAIDVKIKDMGRHVKFDTEENYKSQSAGK